MPPCKARALKVGPGYILVDWASCDGCGRCAEACDRGAILLKSGEVARTAPMPATKPAGAVRTPKGAKPGSPVAPSSPPKPESGSAAPEWSVPEGALALMCAFALYVGAQAVPGSVAHAPVLSGVTLLAYDAALACLVWFLARRRGVGLFAAFRLDVPPEWSSLGLAAALAVGCWLVSVGYRAGAPLLGLQPPVTEGPGLAALFGSGALGVVLTLLVVAVLGPVLEEALLRGAVLGALRRRFGVWPAIVVSAASFSLLHASIWSLLPLSVLGVALGWLAVRSRSLWPAVAAHVLYNLVFVGAALYKALGA
jgi:membrane protease YdiL (CAAX protease family)